MGCVSLNVGAAVGLMSWGHWSKCSVRLMHTCTGEALEEPDHRFYFLDGAIKHSQRKINVGTFFR